MKLIVRSTKNRLKISSLDTSLLEFIKRRLTIKNPNARFTPFGKDELSCISPSFTFMPGLLFDVLKEAKSYSPAVEIDFKDDSKSISIPFSKSIESSDVINPENEKFIYRDYQKQSIQLGMKFGRGIFELATAAGKSLIIYGLIKNIWEYIDKDYNILILVPNVQLVSQMAKDFIEYGCDPSIICKFTATIERKLCPTAKIIISNRSWLTNHIDELPEIGPVIIDEAHMLSSPTSKTFKMVSKIKSTMKFGFTGTMPEFEAAKWNVIGACGQILKIKRAKELQDEGYAAQTKIISIRFIHEQKPQTDPELIELLQEAKKLKDDITLNMIKLEIAKARFPTEWRFIEACDFANQFMLKMTSRVDGNTIMIYDHIEHGNRLKSYLESLNTGHRIYLIDGSTPVAYRENVRVEMEQYDNCYLLGNSKCVSTGMNIKNISNIAFGFSSGLAASKVIQAIGRGLRIKPGQDYLRIFDFYHDLKYSISHYSSRVNLYEKHYDIGVKDILSKVVEVQYNTQSDISKL